METVSHKLVFLTVNDLYELSPVGKACITEDFVLVLYWKQWAFQMAGGALLS